MRAIDPAENEQAEINFMKWLDRNQNLILDDIAKFITDPFIADNSKFIKKTDEAIRLIQENKEHRYAELQKKYSGSVKIEANLKNQFVNDNLFDVNTTEKNSNTEPEIDLAKKKAKSVVFPSAYIQSSSKYNISAEKEKLLKISTNKTAGEGTMGDIADYWEKNSHLHAAFKKETADVAIKYDSNGQKMSNLYLAPAVMGYPNDPQSYEYFIALELESKENGTSMTVLYDPDTLLMKKVLYQSPIVHNQASYQYFAQNQPVFCSLPQTIYDANIGFINESVLSNNGPGRNLYDQLPMIANEISRNQALIKEHPELAPQRIIDMKKELSENNVPQENIAEIMKIEKIKMELAELQYKIIPRMEEQASSSGRTNDQGNIDRITNAKNRVSELTSKLNNSNAEAYQSAVSLITENTIAKENFTKK